MSSNILSNRTHTAHMPKHPIQARYGPYFFYPGLRRALKFGGARSFELLIAAFRDPRVTPAGPRGIGNGIALIWHGTQHQIIVLEGHCCAEKFPPEGPTKAQVLEFRRLSQFSWEELVRFCRNTPATFPSWREERIWAALGAPDPEIPSDREVDSGSHVTAP